LLHLGRINNHASDPCPAEGLRPDAAHFEARRLPRLDRNPQRLDPDFAGILAHLTHWDFRLGPVSTAVNAVRNNPPELIAALS
jgi:hypothetical protein